MTIYKRPSGRYVVQVHDVQTGRARQIGTYDTRREAQTAERTAKARVSKGRERVGSFYQRWMADYPRPAESTAAHYNERARRFSEQYAKRFLDSIDRKTARAWALEHPGEFPTLRTMFGDALRDDLIVTNPFADLGLRRPTPKRRLEADWLTSQNIDELKQAAELVHDPIVARLMGSAIQFSAYSGVRPGELFALEYADVAGSLLHIRRAARSRTRTIGPPKNGTQRTIALVEPAVRALDALPRLHERLLFPTPTGRQAWAPTWHALWKPIRQAAGRPQMQWYEFRHFAATWLLEAGISPEDAALNLGHQDRGQLLLEVYAHKSERSARNRILDALGENHSRDHSQPTRKANNQ